MIAGHITRPATAPASSGLKPTSASIPAFTAPPSQLVAGASTKKTTNPDTRPERPAETIFAVVTGQPHASVRRIR